MKKNIIWFLLVISLISNLLPITLVNAETQSSTINIWVLTFLKTKWVQTSEAYLDMNSCWDAIKENNIKFPNFSRKGCYFNNSTSNYFYLLYDKNLEETVNSKLNISSNTSSSNYSQSKTIEAVRMEWPNTNTSSESDKEYSSYVSKYKNSLDKVINSTKNKKNDYTTSTEYVSFLETLNNKILALKTKHSKTKWFGDLMDYLSDWIISIKTQALDSVNEENIDNILSSEFGLNNNKINSGSTNSPSDTNTWSSNLWPTNNVTPRPSDTNTWENTISSPDNAKVVVIPTKNTDPKLNCPSTWSLNRGTTWEESCKKSWPVEFSCPSIKDFYHPTYDDWFAWTSPHYWTMNNKEKSTMTECTYRYKKQENTVSNSNEVNVNISNFSKLFRYYTCSTYKQWWVYSFLDRDGRNSISTNSVLLKWSYSNSCESSCSSTSRKPNTLCWKVDKIESTNDQVTTLSKTKTEFKATKDSIEKWGAIVTIYWYAKDWEICRINYNSIWTSWSYSFSKTFSKTFWVNSSSNISISCTSWNYNFTFKENWVTEVNLNSNTTITNTNVQTKQNTSSVPIVATCKIWEKDWYIMYTSLEKWKIAEMSVQKIEKQYEKNTAQFKCNDNLNREKIQWSEKYSVTLDYIKEFVANEKKVYWNIDEFYRDIAEIIVDAEKRWFDKDDNRNKFAIALWIRRLDVDNYIKDKFWK